MKRVNPLGQGVGGKTLEEGVARTEVLLSADRAPARGRICWRCGKERGRSPKGQNRHICADIAAAHAYAEHQPDYLAAVREWYARNT